MASSTASSRPRTSTPNIAAIRQLDPRAERGVDQALRLAVGALRVPVCLVALHGADRSIHLLRLAESGAWHPIAGTSVARALADQVLGAVRVTEPGSEAVVRGRVSVGQLGVVEYVALPLTVSGERAGVFAVVDRRQREWGQEQEAMLRDIVGVVAGEVEWHRARTSPALTESQEDLTTALLEISGEGIVVFDRDKRCRIWNPFMERLTSRSAADVIGMGSADLEGLIRITDLDVLMTRALAGESTTTGDQLYRAGTHASDPRFISARVSPLRHGSEAVAGVIVVISDTTLAMTAERRRQHGEEMFRRLTEHSTELLTVIAPDGTVLFDSLSNERILGYAPDELLGRRIVELVHPDDLARVLATLERVGTGEQGSAIVEYRFRHKDGAWRRVLSTCRNLSDDPFVRGIVLNSRDITAWRAMEEQLHEARRMDALGRLAGGVAHDFNNLLTAIKGNVQLLLMDVPPGTSGRDELEEIDRVSDRAAQLTRRLLAFGRPSVTAPEVVEVAEVVRGTMQMLKRLIGGVRLAVNCEQGCRIRADPTHLEQILMNLVLNARDAMPDGGTVALDVRSAVLPPDLALSQPDAGDGRFVLIRVADTGEGMDAATRTQIFEPFFTTKAPGQGTGLGLATVYAIVKQSGGQIAVHSVPGEGTTFDIYLPAAAPAAAPGENAPSR